MYITDSTSTKREFLKKHNAQCLAGDLYLVDDIPFGYGYSLRDGHILTDNLSINNLLVEIIKLLKKKNA